MRILSSRCPTNPVPEETKEAGLIVHKKAPIREETSRRQLISTILLAVVLFQFVYLPGTFSGNNMVALWIVLLSLTICSLVALFQHIGRLTVASILLIVVIDLECTLLLFMSSTRLDVGSLTFYNVLILPELIAVCLLPAASVFPIAIGNTLFIALDITFQPHTFALTQLLGSSMAYSVILQPIGLQLLVAMVAYAWIRATSSTDELVNDAEEEIKLLRCESERKQQVDDDIEQLSQTLVRAANGDYQARMNVTQDNAAWQISQSLNLLLERLQKVDQVAQKYRRLQVQENRRLRAQVSWLTEVCDTVTNGRN